MPPTAAADLGPVLQGAIEANPRLQELGLLPLARGHTVKREVWEDTAFLLSPAAGSP